MNYRVLGRTGLKVSEIGFGAWAIGGNAHGNSYGTTSDATSIRAIHEALDYGVNFFDTADVYGHGHSEEVLGQALNSRRKDVIIATKVGGDFYGPKKLRNFSTDYIRAAVERSLQRLKTDYIDLYQLHNPDISVIYNPATYEIFDQLKKEGKIRFYGISIHHTIEGFAAIEMGKVDCIQLVYNLIRREAERALLPLANMHNLGVIAREPLHNGFLTGKFNGNEKFETGDIRSNWPDKVIRQLVRIGQKVREEASALKISPTKYALQFVLKNQFISTVIPGTKTPEQARENFLCEISTNTLT